MTDLPSLRSLSVEHALHELADRGVWRAGCLRQIDIEAVFEVEQGQGHLQSRQAQFFCAHAGLQLRRRNVRMMGQHLEHGTCTRIGKVCR